MVVSAWKKYLPIEQCKTAAGETSKGKVIIQNDWLFKVILDKGYYDRWW